MTVLRTLLWGPHILVLILGTGIYLSFRGRFMQFWKIPKLLPTALRGHMAEGEQVTAFQALSASLAGSLGTGNIIGVAAALSVGGPGAVVWMWISALFGMMTVYAEGWLSAKFSTARFPGATGYIQKALGKPAAKIYAAGCVLSALGMGTMAQTGAISAAFENVSVPPVITGVMVAVLLIICVHGGLQRAVRVTEKLVPFMSGLFLLACGAVLILCAERIPGALLLMIRSAFLPRAAIGGAAGLWLSVQVGISRGVFTNEAGLGSGTFALCKVKEKRPEEVGALGALQVFIDTIFLCTITALCLLVSSGSGNGAAFTLSAFSSVLGYAGSAAVSASMALFAFATVVAWSCYGMEALSFLVPTAGTAGRNIYILFAALACFWGCILSFDGVLIFCDAFNGVMAIPNTMALLRLSSVIFEENSGKDEKIFTKITQFAKKL